MTPAPSLFRNLPENPLLTLLTGCGLLLLSDHSIAQTAATTTPVGAYTIKVPGKGAEEHQRRTYLGIQLLPERTFAGTVSAVNGNQVTISGWSSPSLGTTAGHRSCLHVLSGPGRGYVAEIEESLATGVRCTEITAGWITPGTSIAVRPQPNLADLFGAANKFLLAGGTEAPAADNVVLWDSASQQERVYYFHSTRNRWEEAEVEADAGGTPVRFPYGLYIIRRSTGTLRIALSGAVASEPVLLPVRPGANILSLPVNLSASLNLLAVTGSHSVVPGVNARHADLLNFEEPTSGLRRGPFYRSSRPGAEGWRAAGVNGGDAESIPLDLLSTLILYRQGSGGYILAEGNAAGGAGFPPLPPDPEPNEQPLSISLSLPFPSMPPGVTLTVETSQDLQNWSTYQVPAVSGNKAICNLPAGQSRAFYRLKVTMSGI